MLITGEEAIKILNLSNASSLATTYKKYIVKKGSKTLFNIDLFYKDKIRRERIIAYAGLFIEYANKELKIDYYTISNRTGIILSTVRRAELSFKLSCKLIKAYRDTKEYKSFLKFYEFKDIKC